MSLHVPPTYEQMRAIARASRHANTCAVAAFPATATPDAWPGEPDLTPKPGDGPFPQHTTAACPCGRRVPYADMYYVDAGGILGEQWVCLDCWMQRRP